MTDLSGKDAYSDNDLKKSLIPKIESLKMKGPVNLSDPNDPETKKRLQEEMQAELLIVSIMKWIQWQINIEVMNQHKEKEAFLKEMDKKAKLEREEFMEDMRKQVDLVSQQTGIDVNKQLLLKLTEQKTELFVFITQLEDEKKELKDIRETKFKEAQVIVDQISKETQDHRRNVVDQVVEEYTKSSGAFQDQRKNPEFEKGVAEYNELEKNYENKLLVYQQKMASAHNEVIELRHQKNEIEKIEKKLAEKEQIVKDLNENLKDKSIDDLERRNIETYISIYSMELKNDKERVVSLGSVNEKLIKAQENEKQILNEKEQSGINEMKKELEDKSKYSEKLNVAKDMNGKVVNHEDLKEALMTSLVNVNVLAQSDINKVIMHAIDEAKKEAKGVYSDIAKDQVAKDQVAEIVVNRNNVMAQINFFNSEIIKRDGERILKPSEISALDKSKVGDIQKKVLDKTNEKDVEATKGIINATYEVYQVDKQIEAKDAEISRAKRRVQMIEQEEKKLTPAEASKTFKEEKTGTQAPSISSSTPRVR